MTVTMTNMKRRKKEEPAVATTAAAASICALLFTSYTIKIRQNVHFQHQQQQFAVAFSKIYGCQHIYMN
jgi:hypothetical protein